MRTSIVLVAVALLGAAGGASAEMVVNGDFQTGDLAGWNWTPTAYADPAMATSVVTFDAVSGQPSLCFRVNPGTDYDHYGIGQEEGGRLWQTLNLDAGMEYDIEVGAAAIRDLGGGSNSDGGRVRLSIGSNLLWDWNIDDIGSGVTVRNAYSGTYTPSTTGAYDLSLLFTRTYTNPDPVMYHYADNISVLPVPEPAGICLLLAGIGGLVLCGRKNTAK